MKEIVIIKLGIRQEFNKLRSRLSYTICPLPFYLCKDEKNSGLIISDIIFNKENTQKVMDILHLTEYGDYTIDLEDFNNLSLKAKEHPCLEFLPFPIWLKEYMTNYPEDEVYISFKPSTATFEIKC